MSYNDAIELADALSNGSQIVEASHVVWRQAAKLLGHRNRNLKDELQKAKDRIEQFEKYEIRQRRKDNAE